MFDIGWQELFIVAILAIMVVGPKDLPRAIRTVTRAIGKLRGLARDFQSGLDEVAREADLDDLKREMNQASKFDITEEVKNTIDPSGEIEKQADIDREVRDTMTDAVRDAQNTTAPKTDTSASDDAAVSDTGAKRASG